MEAENFFDSTLAYVEDYHRETGNVLVKQIERLKVGRKGKGNEELKLSVKTNVRTSGTTIIGETLFVAHGRFRDMGTGSGGRGGNRTPAKWYSPAYYARMAALQGVVNVRVAETASKAVLNQLRMI
jgi:hypothetical protein